MCGHIYFGQQEIWIPCFPWPPHWPPDDPGPLDLTRIRFDRDEITEPDAARVELTQAIRMLEMAGRFREPEVANKLGPVIAEIGTEIARKADLDIKIEWD